VAEEGRLVDRKDNTRVGCVPREITNLANGSGRATHKADGSLSIASIEGGKEYHYKEIKRFKVLWERIITCF
jgi:hypothetical protein